MSVKIVWIKDGEPETSIELSDVDIKCLENDLLDIEVWIKAAIVGKVNNCKKRLIKEWQPKLFNDPEIEFIPANEDDLIDIIISHKDYKNREKREKESNKIKT